MAVHLHSLALDLCRSYFGTKVHLMEHLEQQHKNMYRAWSYMLN